MALLFHQKSQGRLEGWPIGFYDAKALAWIRD